MNPESKPHKEEEGLEGLLRLRRWNYSGDRLTITLSRPTTEDDEQQLHEAVHAFILRLNIAGRSAG
jgi:hypothetical protein